jgi:hypothetical protein
MCLLLQELDRVQQLWQQQADQTGSQIQAALQQHVAQQQHTDQQQQQEAPVRQLKQLMQQHKQELALKVCRQQGWVDCGNTAPCLVHAQQLLQRL